MCYLVLASELSNRTFELITVFLLARMFKNDRIEFLS
jgi:hypothetical protein